MRILGCFCQLSIKHCFINTQQKLMSTPNLVGGGGGRGVTSYIWHSTDVRAEKPPFSALSGIRLAPFFQQKVYEWPDFSGFLCERPHFSNILV